MRCRTIRNAAIISLCLPLAMAQGDELTWPPQLPGGVAVISESPAMVLKPTSVLKPGVKIATAVPEIDFFYFDCQTYPGNPWSVWGDGLAVGA